MDKIFGKWEANVEVRDPGIRNYINLKTETSYLTQGRHSHKKFGKSKINIIERLINNLMRGGTGRKLSGKVIRGRGGPGKKIKMYNVAEGAFEIINKKTNQNPVELFIRGIENAAPREETTRVKFGGMVTPIAVDISPLRRVDFALRNFGKAVAMRSFDNKKSSKEALAEEIILAAKNDPTSHAISKRIEVERIARSSR